MTDPSPPPLLAAVGLTKAFGGADVLIDANLELRAGEIHGLVGENGAGKSTLARLLGGVFPPRAGSILLNGRNVQFSGPKAAIDSGIALIHQEPLSFPDLSVAENIFAGRQPRRLGRIDWRSMQQQAAALLGRLGAAIDPRANVRNLSVADRQMIEMAAALAQHARVFLLDETTAPLTPTETATLFRVLRTLRQEGAALALIGHRLEEMFDICDRLTVLRDGRIVASCAVRETTPAQIIQWMVGRPVTPLERSEPAMHPGQHASTAVVEPVLEVRGLAAGGKLDDISFKLHAGEILGLAGLVGAGRSTLMKALFGLIAADRGQIIIRGQPVVLQNSAEAIRHGLALAPEDRQQQGLIMDFNVWRNATLPAAPRLARRGWLSSRLCRAKTQPFVARLDIRLRTLTQPVRELSGGNQQKVVLARWLLTEPKILLLDEPTRGVDIGAKEQVHRLIQQLAAQGVAVLVASSDLPELLQLSHRLLVMRKGRIAARFERQAASPEAVIAAAAGVQPAAAP